MLLLCILIQEAAEYFSAGSDFKIITLADDYLLKLENNYFDTLSAAIPNGADREYEIVIDVLKEMYGKHVFFRQTLDQVKKAFDIDPESWEISEGMSDKFSMYYDMFLLKNEYIFENYLVHRVLSEGFPFNYKNRNDVMSNYVDLFAKYNLVEFIVTGICRYYKKFDKRHITDCVSLFTRGYEHSEKKYFEI